MADPDADAGAPTGALSLDAELQRSLRALQLAARRALQPQLAGERVGRGRGQARAFAELRGYVPGDDLRHVDWRASARRGKLQLRVFAAPARATLELVVDASASMGFAGLAAPTAASAARTAPPVAAKWHEARVLAYALGWLALAGGDAVGLSCWQAQATRLLPLGGGPRQRHRLLTCLATLAPRGAGVAERLAPFVLGPPRRRRVVVISDFLQRVEESAATLVALQRAGHDVWAVHVRHPDEVRLPGAAEGTLVDLEDGRAATLQPGDGAAAFAARVAAQTAALRQQLVAGGVGYVPHVVGAPLHPVVQAVAAGAAPA